jgi:hypothetical protein
MPQAKKMREKANKQEKVVRQRDTEVKNKKKNCTSITTESWKEIVIEDNQTSFAHSNG